MIHEQIRRDDSAPPGRRRTVILTLEGRAGVFPLFAFSLCLLLPGLLSGWTLIGHSGSGQLGSVPIQWAIIAWSGLRLSLLATKAEPRPFAVIFWLYVYVWIGIAGLLQIIAAPALGQPGPWSFHITDSTLFESQLAALVVCGCVEFWHRFTLGSSGSPKSVGRRLRPGRIRFLAIVVVVAAYPMYKLEGGNALFHSREQLASAISGTVSTSALKHDLPTVVSFAALYGVIISRRFKQSRVGNLLLGTLAVVVLVLNFPISQPRFWVVTMLTALTFAHPLVFRRPLGMRALIVAVVLAGVLLFPYLAYFRYSTGYVNHGSVTQTLTTSGDYDSPEMVAAVIQDTKEHGLRLGKQLLGDVFFFVPRSHWASKPNDTGAMVADNAGLAYDNLSAPLWSEFYIDFGWPGVIVLSSLYGFLMWKWDTRFIRGETSGVQFMVPLMAGYSAILLRGPLLQAMARLFVLAFLGWWLTERYVLPNGPGQLSPRLAGDVLIE